VPLLQARRNLLGRLQVALTNMNQRQQVVGNIFTLTLAVPEVRGLE
jgi:hypothetical protein